MTTFVERIAIPIIMTAAAVAVLSLLIVQWQRLRVQAKDAGSQRSQDAITRLTPFTFTLELSAERVAAFMDYLQGLKAIDASERLAGRLREGQEAEVRWLMPSWRTNVFNAAYAFTDFDFLRGVGLNAVLRGARLRNAILTGATLKGADLSGADLTQAVLDKAVLAGANLSNALMSGCSLLAINLQGAILAGADFSGADLSKSNMTNSAAMGAIFIRARLRGADLREATLTRADLTEADLSGADLSTANLLGATLQAVVYDEETKWPADFAYLTNKGD